MVYECDNLGHLLSKASRLAKWEFNNRLSDFGLTSPQWAVLMYIYNHRDKEDKHLNLTPAAIAERLHYDRPTISGIIDRLVRQGWAYREVNPEDRRSQVITVTDRLVELMPRLEEMSVKTMEQAVQDFSQEEIEEFKKYLGRIVKNFSK